MSAGLDQFHEQRFLGGVKKLAALLRQHNIDKWATWFEGDLQDYIAGQGPPRQIARQTAVIQHVLMAFGGMSNFMQLQLVNETGEPLLEANERLEALATNVWAAARGVQGSLLAAAQERDQDHPNRVDNR